MSGRKSPHPQKVPAKRARVATHVESTTTLSSRPKAVACLPADDVRDGNIKTRDKTRRPSTPAGSVHPGIPLYCYRVSGPLISKTSPSERT